MSEGQFRPSKIQLMLISRGEINISVETKNVDLACSIKRLSDFYHLTSV